MSCPRVNEMTAPREPQAKQMPYIKPLHSLVTLLLRIIMFTMNKLKREITLPAKPITLGISETQVLSPSRQKISKEMTRHT
jgi:hypothetical protein